MLVSYLGIALAFLGSMVILLASLGALKFNDHFARVHVYGITDSLGIALLIPGLSLMNISSIISLKLLFMGAIMLFTASISTSLWAHVVWEE